MAEVPNFRTRGGSKRNPLHRNWLASKRCAYENGVRKTMIKRPDEDAGEALTAAFSSLPIELCKILKSEGLVQSGGEAKHVIASGLVKVNGEVETRKRKKIFAGDCIEMATTTLRVVLAADSGSVERDA